LTLRLLLLLLLLLLHLLPFLLYPLSLQHYGVLSVP
jgi:hypothetical protein